MISHHGLYRAVRRFGRQRRKGLIASDGGTSALFTKKGLLYVLMRYYTIAMKKHLIPKKPLKNGVEALATAINGLKNADQVYAFLVDLCTPAELEAMADRWQVVEPLARAMPYRQIHDDTGVSVTTIGRVARCLELGSGGYQLALAQQRKGARA